MRPILEGSSLVWDYNSKGLIKKLEALQSFVTNAYG